MLLRECVVVVTGGKNVITGGCRCMRLEDVREVLVLGDGLDLGVPLCVKDVAVARTNIIQPLACLTKNHFL